MDIRVLITGASRGYGRDVARAFASCAGSCASCSSRGTTRGDGNCDRDRVRLVLSARKLDGLRETERLLSVDEEQRRRDAKGDDGDVAVGDGLPEIDVRLLPADLGDLDSLEDRVGAMLDELLPPMARCGSEGDDKGGGTSSASPSFHHFVLINNAGTLGYVGPCCAGEGESSPQRTKSKSSCSSSSSNSSFAAFRGSVDLNVTSSTYLSSRFVRECRRRRRNLNVGRNSEEGRNDKAIITVVNVSSLAAVKPFPTLAVYSACKAARDAFHASMALELLEEEQGKEEEDGIDGVKVKILNYAPGPMGTDMMEEIREAAWEGRLAESLKLSYGEGSVNPRDSADVLAKLVLLPEGGHHDNDGGAFSFKFKSGDHVDYYDVVGSDGSGFAKAAALVSRAT